MTGTVQVKVISLVPSRTIMADKVQHSAKNETEKSDSSGNDQLPKQKSSNEDPELDDLLDSKLDSLLEISFF